MIRLLLGRMQEMEARITDRVIEHVEGILEKRLVRICEELQAEADEGLDNRFDALKEDIRGHMIDEVREQVQEQVGDIEEEVADLVLSRLE